VSKKELRILTSRATIKRDGKFLDYVGDYQILKAHSAHAVSLMFILWF